MNNENTKTNRLQHETNSAYKNKTHQYAKHGKQCTHGIHILQQYDVVSQRI